MSNGPAPKPIDMAQVRMLLVPTSRPASILVPVDITDEELMNLAAFVLTGLRANITPPSPIWVPPDAIAHG